MADDRRAGPGFIAFTVLGLIGLVAVVALLIQSYDTSSDVAAVETALATAPAAPDANLEVVAPIGGVATGGGGTATDASANLALLSVGVLATLTLLTGAGMALRQRAA